MWQRLTNEIIPSVSYQAKGAKAEALQGRESVQFREELSNF